MGNLRSVTGKDESYFGIQSPPTPRRSAPTRRPKVDKLTDNGIRLLSIELSYPAIKLGSCVPVLGFG